MSSDGFPRVSTRGHFRITWFRGERLTDGHDDTDYDLVGDVPGITGDAPEELLVHVHGFMNDDASAVRLFRRMRESLRQHNYDHPVVGFSWDSDWNANRWWSTVRIARRNGRKLAAFVRDYRQRNPGTKIRFTGHSLGAQVTVSALEALRQHGVTAGIPSASLLGGAIRTTDVATDGEYGDAIAAVPASLHNYYSDRDGVLKGAFGPAERASAVGRVGCRGTAPGNYHDHDVSDEVRSHFDYIRPDRGCIGRVVADFE